MLICSYFACLMGYRCAQQLTPKNFGICCRDIESCFKDSRFVAPARMGPIQTVAL